MRDARYRQLFTIGVLHNYYIDKYRSDFTFVPTSKTQKIFRSYGMLMKPLKNGFTVLFNENNNTPLTEIKEDEEDNTLTFIIKNGNPYIHHISDISLDYKDKYVFNNHTSNINEDSHKLLHLSNYVGDSEQIGEDTEITINEQDFGLLEISLKASDDENYGIITNDTINHQVYTIHFDCRKVFWKYYIIPRNGKEYTAFQIISKDDKKFTEPQLETLSPLGKNVPSMTSTEQIDLKERSNERLRLQFSEKKEDEINNRAKKLTIQLPSPEARNIKPVDAKDKVYASIYVYI